MRNFMGFLAVISVGAMSPAFATDPPPPQQQPAAASPTSTEVISPPPASAARVSDEPSGTSDPPADAARTSSPTADPKLKLVASDTGAEKELNRLKSAGYKPEVHGSEVVFCRREAVVGSRFEKKVCNTAEKLQQQAAIAQELAEQSQRNARVSPPQH
jgi:hypothetical protein